MRKFILLLLVSLSVPACGPATLPPVARKAAPDRSFDELLGLIRQRLDVMHDVAHWKWANKGPIEDPTRESALLDDVAKQGTALGLDQDLTRAFFRGQIEAAKVIQRADFHRWETEPSGPKGEAPDLAGILRPRIDSLNKELLAALARAKPQWPDRAATSRLRSRAQEILVGDGIDSTVRDAAIGPLLTVDP